MTMAKSVEKRRYWRAVVRRQEGSGLSVAAFCRSEGVSEASFYAWKRRLTRDAGQVSGSRRPATPKTAARTAPRSRPKTASETAQLATGFVPVRIRDEPRRAMFQVRWPGGFSVRIPAECDRGDVEVVLTAVDRLARQRREEESC
jgi:hypothetical protein